MARSRINVNVEANNDATASSIYKTVYLKPFVPIADQIQEPYIKYVIKWVFTLSNDTVTIPRNCILEFDGGFIGGTGTLVSSNNDTKIVNLYGYNVIDTGQNKVALSGTFQTFTGVYE